MDNIAESSSIQTAERSVNIKNPKVFKRLIKLEHLNLLKIFEIKKNGLNQYSIVEENFHGVTLAEKLKSGVTEDVFEDYVLQICDALQFIAGRKSPIAYNALTPENIMIGEDDLLKLSNFEYATENDGREDIVALGQLIKQVDAKFIKKYKKIIENCLNGEYENAGKVKGAIHKRSRSGFVFLLIPFFMIVLRLSRLSHRMRFEQIFDMIKSLFNQ